ncbi:hypothetical protein EZ456_12080 [Pedobacter psychrodurus]|uniref:Uncharacterized protein n=1 Tax=Pedobacter psychrodurus TaxID=2530456 RepID=A0A4V2MQW5_9SPHI|nr:hypothetical protein [Pedobacter psychrodurus]TCD26689.1 hypothetical protein EZ456_12080 [Pedobacter psychrodurus]
MFKNHLPTCLAISICLFSSCISRLSRPAITGTILDYQNKPVVGCKVGEAFTDANGKFYLKEIRYNKFFIPEIFTMEAPPLHISEDIKKEGFLSYTIEGHNAFGGGQGKGAATSIDTIYLKRVNEIIKPEDYIYANWIFTTNKNLDTLYGTNANFRLQNSVTNNRDFVEKVQYGLTYRFNATKKPDSTWSAESYDLKTTYSVLLKTNSTYSGKKVREYKNPWKHRMEYDRTYREPYIIPSDSINTKGTFSFLKDKIIFDGNFNKAKNNYKIDSIDRDIIILTRINTD